MMLLIMPSDYGEFINELAEMHRLRHRVFKQRLDWDVQVSGDMEVDEFDVLRPVHLLHRSTDGRIQGGVRLLPSNGPTMIRDTFPIFLDGQAVPRSDQVWESSRFVLDVPPDAPKAGGGLASATYELFAGMIEFGLSIHLDEIVTVTDARMERVLRRAGWPLRPIGKPRPLGPLLPWQASWRCQLVPWSASESRARSLARCSGRPSSERPPSRRKRILDKPLHNGPRCSPVKPQNDQLSRNESLCLRQQGYRAKAPAIGCGCGRLRQPSSSR